MPIRCLPLALLPLLLAASPTLPAAEPLRCPSLLKAQQLEGCPSDEQLQTGYTGYCSDNRRLYASDPDTCTRFENYRRLKNVALWEAGPDGAFQGYLSCELPRERILAVQPRSVAVSRLGSVTRVACDYGEGLSLSLRTKARCKVEGPGDCGADGASCRVRCEAVD